MDQDLILHAIVTVVSVSERCKGRFGRGTGFLVRNLTVALLGRSARARVLERWIFFVSTSISTLSTRSSLSLFRNYTPTRTAIRVVRVTRRLTAVLRSTKPLCGPIPLSTADGYGVCRLIESVAVTEESIY